MTEVNGQPEKYTATASYTRPGAINTSVSFAASLEITDDSDNINATKV